MTGAPFSGTGATAVHDGPGPRRPAGRSGTPAPDRGVAFARSLARFGDAPAVTTPTGRRVAHAELAERGADAVRALEDRRHLVAMRVVPEVESVAAYVGALAAGHPVLVLPADEGRARELARTYRPDVLLDERNGWFVDDAPRAPAHDLHPDLALLLPTSGSTGSPKLVRLSAANLDANAGAIASFLGLEPADVGATTLPLHYCYGLSVLHSHLAVGASVSLTRLSVSDPCFWTQVERDGVTGLAGVPYTFELLERVGVDHLDLPHLRYLTQAGGRMDPHRVRAFAELGRRTGFDLFVMYGQTEATARMAYLPPAEALRHPDAVGVAVPGGRLRVDAPEGRVGELVYRGPNVMMGYAERAADLAAGHAVDELRTGDLGHIGPDGLVRVVGRTSRFVKPFGIRVDLDALERTLAADGVPATCTGDDTAVLVAVPPGSPPALLGRVGDDVVGRLGLPRSAVRVVALEVPRLANGKPDHAGLRRLAEPAQGAPAPDPASDQSPSPSSVAGAFAEVLGLAPSGIDPVSSFVDLGGDSLSYVELSVALEDLLGEVPPDWHLTPAGQLQRKVDGRAATGARRGAPGSLPAGALHAMETNVVLRAVATVLIVATHSGAVLLQGGAHVLLAVAGFNFARFRLPGAGRPGHLRATAASLARIAVPTALWLAFQFTYAEPLEWPRAFLVNNYLGTGLWEYWYLEALLQILVVASLVVALPRVAALERRRPFATAMAVLVAATALRYDALDIGSDEHWMYRPDTLLWCFALGWAAQRADTTARRVAVTAVGAVCVWDFFDKPGREVFVAVGLLALVWLARVRVPAPAHRWVAAVASASLYVYLTQWAVLPVLRGNLHGWWVTAVALALGLLAAALARVVERSVRRWWAAARRRRPTIALGAAAAGPAASPVSGGRS